jgi:isochorismate synthase EntC
VNSFHEHEGEFPIALCNGYCGIGRSDINDPSIPHFYAKSFDGKQEISFRPKHFFKYETPAPSTQVNSLQHSEDFPTSDQLTNSINLFKSRDDLKKIVLAKKRIHTFAKPLCQKHLLSKLLNNFPKENTFAIALNEESIFFGSTPEDLFVRDGEIITVDSIAGTTTHDNKDLLFTPKYIEEHKIVTDYVESCLSDLCTTISTGSLMTKQAAHLLHLHRKISGRLKNHITDDNIIKKLHPTPATLGFPKAASQQFLKNHEGLDRGFYAGCIGWRHETHTHLKVALRSGLAIKNTLFLYAGAGITGDSVAADEITEINQKFKTLEEVFLEKILSN